MIIGVNMGAINVTQQIADDCAAAGFMEVRLMENEAAVEQTSQVYTWTTLDAAVGYLEAAGLDYIIPLWGFQAANTSNFDATCDLPTVYAFETFGNLVIGRYGANAHFMGVEMGNEEYCLRSMSSSCMSGATYAPIAQAAYPYLKGLAPTKSVGACAQANWVLPPNSIWCPQWENQYLAAITGNGPYIDYWNMHYYPASSGPNDPLASIVNAINNLKSATGGGLYPNIPIRFTEMNWHRNTAWNGKASNSYPTTGAWPQVISEAMQTKYLMDSISAMEANGVAAVNIWNFAEDYTSYDVYGRQVVQQLGWQLKPSL
jgi:hypothetical protein